MGEPHSLKVNDWPTVVADFHQERLPHPRRQPFQTRLADATPWQKLADLDSARTTMRAAQHIRDLKTGDPPIRSRRSAKNELIWVDLGLLQG